MVVTLPIATIKRILDRVTNLPEQASGLFVAGIVIPTPPTSPGPRLPENIVAALEKARDDKTLIGGTRRTCLELGEIDDLHALQEGEVADAGGHGTSF